MQETEDIEHVELPVEDLKPPTRKEVNDTNKFSRMHFRVSNYLYLNQRSFQEEYILIYNKESKLSRVERDYVIHVVEQSMQLNEEE